MTTIIKCPLCKKTLSDLMKLPRLGCPQCYTAFGEILKKSIHFHHNATKHIGKKPKFNNIKPIFVYIEILNQKIKEFVEKSEYEKAAIAKEYISKFNILEENKLAIADDMEKVILKNEPIDTLIENLKIIFKKSALLMFEFEDKIK